MAESKTDKSFTAASLIVKYLKGGLSEDETNELQAWIAASEQNQQLFYELSAVETIEKDIQQFESSNPETGWQRMQGKITAKGIRRKKKNWKMAWRSAAAIFVLTMALWQVWYHTISKPVTKPNLVSQYGDEVLPGTQKAVLILSDGTKIALDGNGDSSFTEKGSSVQRTANGIFYSKGSAINDIAWNTIHIPNGGEYRVVLEDGTKVWLNAASTLRYPVQFTGKERRVELVAGEAYFEIAKNKEKPFIVVADRMDVQAVGTAFNVNSYADADSVTETTLVEGIIKVKALNKASTLRPGEKNSTNQATSTIATADIEAVTAWKNGLFLFSNKALPEVMKQLARWYDVEIMYDKNFKEKKFFTGEIKRNVPVSKLLQMMELTGIARFRITNNTIIVMPFTP